jgi:hypothetical protein
MRALAPHEAIHLPHNGPKKMDCFAALAMTLMGLRP